MSARTARDVTLLCVETRRPALALEAMRRCMEGIDYADALLLTPQAVSAPAPVRVVPIAPLDGIRAYSRFMVRDLAAHVATSHVLVCQWDGFVADARAWDDAFLGYDYIGAPWPDGRVGNGGFSLRSRRLLEVAAGLPGDDPHPEDAWLCITQRAALEARGVRFAPADVAARFAFERVEPAGPTFGVHGLFNFDRVFAEDALIAWFAQCDDALLHSVPARRLLRNLHRTGRHRAAAALQARRMAGPWRMRLDALKLRLDAALGGRRRRT